MKMIEFPWMRMNVLVNLQELSDASEQTRRWIKQEKYGSFDEVIHCLFDDSRFEGDPRGTIGALLFNEKEADLIKDTIDLIDELFDKYGKDLSDAEYIAKPEWPGIMASAQTAYKAMIENDLRFMEPAQRAELYKEFRIDV